MNRPRTLLADDHTMMLESIAACIESNCQIIGTAGDGQALVKAALRLRPELIILDITMPVLNGLDAARRVIEMLPETRIIFLTMHINAAYVAAALETGATGYVLKSAAADELLNAISVVLRNRIYISPGLPGQNPENSRDASRTAASFRLSTREREVLKLIADGLPSKDIALDLNISSRTVGFHRDNIRNKLGLHSTAALTKYWIEEGNG